MTRPETPGGPSAPVDVFAAPAAAESPAWRSASLVPLAAFGFALLAWVATAVLAWQSETRGVQGATVAMFPTGFGAAGLIARGRELERTRPSTRRLLLLSSAGGVVAMVLFVLFMSAVWPAL